MDGFASAIWIYEFGGKSIQFSFLMQNGHLELSMTLMPAGNNILLERTLDFRTDIAPDATELLKELLVPGSTK